MHQEHIFSAQGRNGCDGIFSVVRATYSISIRVSLLPGTLSRLRRAGAGARATKRCFYSDQLGGWLCVGRTCINTAAPVDRLAQQARSVLDFLFLPPWKFQGHQRLYVLVPI